MTKNYGAVSHAEINLPGVSVFAAGQKVVGAEKSTPAAVKTLTAVDPTVRAESLKLVQRLFLAPGRTAPKVAVFASSDSNRESSWLCALAAKVLAESAPVSVCLVEGTCGAPSLPQLFGVGNHHGLMDALRQEGKIKEFAKQMAPENLWLLSGGAIAEDSVNLFHSSRMKERIDELRREFDHVLIDAPPLSAYAEGLILGGLADGVVLVLEANATRREAALRVAENLRMMKIPLLGAVLSNRTFPIPAGIYKRL